MEWIFSNAQTNVRVVIQRRDEQFAVRVGDVLHRAKVLHSVPPRLTLLIDGQHVVESNVEWQSDGCTVNLGNVPYRFAVTSAHAHALGGDRRAAPAPQIRAPLPGRIVDVLVARGDRVQAGQPVCIIEAMKMQNEICAGGEGVIAGILVTAGTSVEANAVLITLA